MRTPEQSTPIPVFYLHEGKHPFCSRPGCHCMQHDRTIEALLRDVIARKLKLRQVANGAIAWEGTNARPTQ